MQSKLEYISSLIKNRRSIGPHMFNNIPVADDIINTALENATWAPNHKKTEPWKFHVMKGSAKNRLGIWAGEALEKYTPEGKFNPLKQKKLIEKITLSSHVVALIFQRNPESGLPEWEEIAAFSMAVQNFWLSLEAANVVGYWSSPAAVIDNYSEFVALDVGQQCLGLFYLGYKKKEIQISSKREPLSLKVRWTE